METRESQIREAAPVLDRAWHLRLLELMHLSRESDEREGVLVRQGKAWMHVSCGGHEALMAIPLLLRREDFIFPYYRGYHLMMAKGMPRATIARDFFAKETSTSGGRSMAVHAGSTDLRIFPGAAPTGSQCTPAVGVAWAQKRWGRGEVTVCSIGDGATRQGEFYEAVSMAVELRLPVLFLVEDNGYAISTPTRGKPPFSVGVFAPRLIRRVDGRDVFAVVEAAQEALADLRQGRGPTILWCEVDRLCPHTVNDDHRLYRPEEELRGLVDPLELYAERLVGLGLLTREEHLELRERARWTVREAYRVAEEDPDPDPAFVHDEIFGPPIPHAPLDLEPPAAPPGTAATTLVREVNRVLGLGLERDPRMLLFGQDIEDPKGGVFGLTKGLSTRFPDRVMNAPVAETTILGSAVGLALLGFRPVFEIQFIDFITTAFDQLVNQIASLRWRTWGQWSCPLVLYAPYGAYTPAGGLWHSQSNDGWWTHVPGLRVAVPSTPADAAGLFWTAFQDEDPSLILLPKHLLRAEVPAAEPVAVPWGTARLCREGTDATVVSWGNGVALAEEAARDLALEGIAAEILDLRTLVPCDWQAVARSVAKTGRLVVVQEANRTSSFGASLLAAVVSDPARYGRLSAPPCLVSREDVHVPFHPELERAVLPSAGDVAAAVRAAFAASGGRP